VGIVLPHAEFLIKEWRRRPMSGEILSLGFPQSGLEFGRLSDLCAAHRFPLAARLRELCLRIPASPTEIVSADDFFRCCGFEACHAMDRSGYEGADVLFDLNEADLPEHLHGRFDFIFNHGTLEHVFHLPNALNNLFRMLKVGGRVHHFAPASNHVDHGFYSLSPCFFLDFYSANRWQVDAVQVALVQKPYHATPPFVADYYPGSFDQVKEAGLDGNQYITVCLATKTEESTGDRVPQQGHYQRMVGWDQ
jgi:SAM-dependent methyltransferase